MKILLIIPLLFAFSTIWAEVSVQNDQKYIGDDGALHIVGEINNDLSVPLNQIDISATLYSENVIVDTISSGSLVNTIMPGMKAPFDIIVVGNDAKLVDDYSLDLEYQVKAPKSQVIDVTSSEISRDGLNNLIIQGTVENKGDVTANTISVVATLYDREGKVAAVSKIHPEPDYLRSDDQAYFMVSIPDKTQTSEVVDYSLVAESEEYAAVPEFPIGSTILLSASVFGYILITRYARRTIASLVSAADLR